MTVLKNAGRHYTRDADAFVGNGKKGVVLGGDKDVKAQDPATGSDATAKGPEQKAPEMVSMTQAELDAKIADAVAKAKADAEGDIDAKIQRALNDRKVEPARAIPDNAAQESALAAARQGPRPALSLLARGEATTIMHFPRRVLLTLADHSRVEFAPGPQHVPNSLVGHSWLAANGAKVMHPGVPFVEKAPEPEPGTLKAHLPATPQPGTVAKV